MHTSKGRLVSGRVSVCGMATVFWLMGVIRRIGSMGMGDVSMWLMFGGGTAL